MTTNQINDTPAYSVEGMTCSHCVTPVRDEVSEIAAEAGYAVVS